MNLSNRNIRRAASLDCEELKIYTGMSEAQLLHYYEPGPGLFIAESPMIIDRAMDAGYQAESFLVEEQLLDGQHAGDDIVRVLDRAGMVPVYTAPLDEIKRITGYTITRGILAAMKRKELSAPEAVLHNAKRIVVMEDVMNPTNLGAIFRSAAALGIDAVLLTKCCTDPLYRRAARVSMGTVFQIPWTYMGEWYPKDDSVSGLENDHPGISFLHELGFKAVAMALKDDSIGMRDLNPGKDEKIAFVMGSEGPGLKDDTICSCDVTVKIPMYNGVDSLNVAAASAIAFWQIMK